MRAILHPPGTMWAVTLPIYPPPLPREWIGSWVWRLAQANACEVDTLLKHLGIGAESSLSDDALRVLSGATGHPLKGVQAITSLVDPLLDVGRRGHQPRTFLGVRYVQVCPQCLAGDSIPYLRVDWVRQTQAVCAEHDVALVDECPHCRTALLVTSPPNSLAKPAAPKVAPRDTLRQCWLCGYDLAQVLPKRVTVHADDRRLKEQQEREWAPFRTAVWTMFATSNATELLSPSELHLRALPRQQNSKPFAQPLASRLALQHLHDWIFFTHGDGFPDWMTRLRSVTTALLGRLQTDMLSPRRWLYLSWLLTRINEDNPGVLKQDFPGMTTALMMRWRGEYVVPDVEEGWTLTDEQWQVVAPHLEWAVWHDVAAREAFEFLIRWSVLRGSASVSQQDQYVGFRKQIVQWQETGTLGVVLGLLEQHFNQGKRVQKTRLWVCAAGQGAEWQVQTARWLLSDGMIELARETNRPLHRRLLMALVAGYERGFPVAESSSLKRRR